jgi:hypothetical protein
MPNFERTKVDPNLLFNKSCNIEINLDALEQAFLKIDDCLRNTLYPAWKDIASTLFFQQYSADAQVFKAYLDSMRAVNTQLREASGIFDNADEKAKDMVNKLKIT